jgi:gamma-glutamylcysteine synthetase
VEWFLERFKIHAYLIHRNLRHNLWMETKLDENNNGKQTLLVSYWRWQWLLFYMFCRPSFWWSCIQ